MNLEKRKDLKKRIANKIRESTDNIDKMKLNRIRNIFEKENSVITYSKDLVELAYSLFRNLMLNSSTLRGNTSWKSLEKYKKYRNLYINNLENLLADSIKISSLHKKVIQKTILPESMISTTNILKEIFDLEVKEKRIIQEIIKN